MRQNKYNVHIEVIACDPKNPSAAGNKAIGTISELRSSGFQAVPGTYGTPRAFRATAAVVAGKLDWFAVPLTGGLLFDAPALRAIIHALKRTTSNKATLASVWM